MAESLTSLLYWAHSKCNDRWKVTCFCFNAGHVITQLRHCLNSCILCFDRLADVMSRSSCAAPVDGLVSATFVPRTTCCTRVLIVPSCNLARDFDVTVLRNWNAGACKHLLPPCLSDFVTRPVILREQFCVTASERHQSFSAMQLHYTSKLIHVSY